MFRKRFIRRGTSFRSFRRRGSGLRLAKAPQRWSTADFFIDSVASLPAGSAAESLTFFHVAAQTQIMQSQTFGLAVAMGAVVRKLHIGGIVFDYGFELEGDAGGGGATMADGCFWHTWGLCTDRLLTISGNPSQATPASIQNWSPWTSDFPVAAVGGSTPTDESGELNRVQRILWHKTHYRQIRPRRIFDDVEGVLYVPQEQLLAPRNATVNRRLRLTLDNLSGLFFYVGTRNSPTGNLQSEERVTRRWVQGQLYYRFGT